MSDERHDDFERELEALGPLMAHQDIYAAQNPDVEFVQRLRDRLTGTPAAIPAAKPTPRRRARFAWIVNGSGAAVAAVVAILILFLTAAPQSSVRHTAFPVPIPGRDTILHAYPMQGIGAGGTPSPWETDFDQSAGVPYAGHLRLRATSLTKAPSKVDAFELEGPGFDLPRLHNIAHHFGVTGPIRHATFLGERWAYVADRIAASPGPAFPPPPGVHSVAISLKTGELIYHDTAVLGSVTRSPSASQIASGRRWLSQLGWPGGKMPQQLPLTQTAADEGYTVQFGWPGAGPAAPASAILFVNASGQVGEARVYPPIARREAVPIRKSAVAWSEVQREKAPIASVPGLDKPGTGSERQSSLIGLLTPGPQSRLYLVPTYRFAGNAVLEGFGRASWYALVPAQ